MEVSTCPNKHFPKAQQPKHSHLADKPILVDRPSLLSLSISRRLSPHLLDILQYHIAMPIKRLYSCEQLSVVPARDQDLCV
jgi:hypothetical protein